MMRRHFVGGGFAALAVCLVLGAPAARTAVRNSAVGCHVPERVTSPVSHAATSVAEVSITFDDAFGPPTDEILQTFADYRMHGTFFVIGSDAAEHPSRTRDVLDAGHELGNHSMNHRDSALLPDFGFAEMRSASRTIRHLTGFRPCEFRPPYLSYNDGVVRAADRLDLTTVTATRGNDMFTTDPDAVASYALQDIGPGDIILMHQIPQSAAALPEILSGLRDRGLRSVSVTDLLGGTFSTGD
jgi:peptidoglycan-N-acetylglucosamine deacetylase